MTLKENCLAVMEKLTEACLKNSIDRSKIRVLAATKTQAPEQINRLLSCGITLIGENRVQEFTAKYESVDSRFEQHFIGALQTNKVKYLVGKVTTVHSVDRPQLLKEIDLRSAAAGVVTDVLIEVNVGGEASKSGVSPEDAKGLAELAAGYENVRFKGIMSVLPINAPESLYERMRTLSVKLREEYPEAGVLSMGMSGDYLTAVKHGANIIRLGEALFGKRIYV